MAPSNPPTAPPHAPYYSKAAARSAPAPASAAEAWTLSPGAGALPRAQVVAAQWLTDSAAANRLLPCTDYKTDPRRPLPLTSVTPAWPTTPPSPPRAAAVHPGKENHRPAAQIAATGPTIAATAAPKKSPSQPDAQHGHSKGSTRQLLLALQPGTSSAAAQPGHMSRQACSLSPEQHQEQPKSPRPSLHDAAQSHASKQNGAEPPSQRPQDFSFGTGPPPPAQCLDPQPAREGLQGRLDAAGRGHEHAVSLNRWLQHSARAPPPECPGTPRILPGPRTPPPPQSAPQPPSRGLPAGMPDMDLSEIEGHMRLREAPAAQGSAGLGGLEWGGSPWGALRARSVAKDEAGARVSVPPSPSEAWNADDLVIPGGSPACLPACLPCFPFSFGLSQGHPCAGAMPTFSVLLQFQHVCQRTFKAFKLELLWLSGHRPLQ